MFRSKIILSNQWIQVTRRNLASTPVKIPKKSYELVIIGGGAGGLAIAARFSRYFKALKKPSDSIAVIEPRDVHYYQPLWTLVGGGLKDLKSSGRPMSQVMPANLHWIQESCSKIDPVNNKITLSGASGSLDFKYLVVAAGIQLDWNKIDGLVEALQQPDSGVCSNYSEKTVLRTWQTLQKFNGGHAVFTYPDSPVKCAGAPQKIAYLTDAYLNKKGLRSKTKITYNTTLPAIFAVPKYSKALDEMCKQRQINVNLRTNLVKIDPGKKIAYFKHLDKKDQKLIEMNYDMLHVTPPMSAPKFLQSLSTDTSGGFVAVDDKTLQHVKFRNIFSLGDCSSLPTSKTAAAIASQNYILARNLLQLIQKDNNQEDFAEKIDFSHHYDGYTSCPIVTGNSKCIMAEFDYKKEPVETFPIDQSKQRRIMFYTKKDFLPFIYWNGLLKGYWSGPGIFRKFLHFGLK